MRTRTLIATLASIGALGLAAAACQTGATMWGPCTNAAGGNPSGTDGRYVLICRNGTWEPLMTVDEWVRTTRGERVTPAPLPTRPVPTTTLPAATVDVQFAGAVNNDLLPIGVCDPGSGPSPLIAAQTFTAGRTGNLTAVGLIPRRDSTPGPLIVEIRSVTAGVPTGTVLGRTTWDPVATPSGNDWVDLTLEAPVAITAGQPYAIAMSVNGSCPTTGSWSTQSAFGGYATGNAAQDYGTGFTLYGFDFDTYFRTWVR